MATQTLTVTQPTLNSTGTDLGVGGVAGASAGMTAGVAGAGNGFNFANNGGKTILIVLNTGAGARTITPLITTTGGGVAIVSPTRSIGSGKTVCFRFNGDYENSDKTVTVECEHAEIKAACIMGV